MVNTHLLVKQKMVIFHVPCGQYINDIDSHRVDECRRFQETKKHVCFLVVPIYLPIVKSSPVSSHPRSGGVDDVELATWGHEWETEQQEVRIAVSPWSGEPPLGAFGIDGIPSHNCSF
jgi:hypothetical protein